MALFFCVATDTERVLQQNLLLTDCSVVEEAIASPTVFAITQASSSLIPPILSISWDAEQFAISCLLAEFTYT